MRPRHESRHTTEAVTAPRNLFRPVCPAKGTQGIRLTGKGVGSAFSLQNALGGGDGAVCARRACVCERA